MNYPTQRSTRRIGVALCSLFFMFLHCNLNHPSDSNYSSWTFSGYIIDGNTDKPLSGAKIYYQTDDCSDCSSVTSQTGEFRIDGLPFGEASFRFVYKPADTDSARYTEKTIIESSWKEGSPSEGLLANVSQIVKLFPLSGALSGQVVIKLGQSGQLIPSKNTPLKIYYKDTALNNSSPSLFQTTTDSTGAFQFSQLPLADGVSFEIPAIAIDNIAYALTSYPQPFLFENRDVAAGTLYLVAVDSTNWPVNLVTSNVLSANGFGATGVPVSIIPWYILSVKPDSTTLDASIEGGGNPDAVVAVRGDTVFVLPTKNLSYNSPITISIFGKDANGNRINLIFNGAKTFKTEQGVFPLASNTWDASGQPMLDFGIYATMWVKFSEPLDTNIGLIEWAASDADNAVFGSGNATNATVWISSDTLFVKPDARLKIDYGQTVGFKTTVRARSGTRSSPLDFKVRLSTSPYFVTWTNTTDQLGMVRSDFGLLESVKVVSNEPIQEITGVSGINDAAVPPDLSTGNIRLSGDTIIFTPTLRYKPQTVYGIDFDITFKNGHKRSDMLAITWKTAPGVKILSTNAKTDGNFRKLSAFGDSLVVSFSKAIDTTKTAPVLFKASMKNVNGRIVSTIVRWNSSRTTATILPLDTLPTADYNASPAYTAAAVKTRAIDSVSFDLTTDDGEQVFMLGPETDRLQLHTEQGLCAIASNLLPKHDPLLEIDTSESPIDTFSIDGVVQVSFNRPLDTFIMNTYGPSLFAGIVEKQSGIRLPCDVQVENNATVLSIRPRADLHVGKEYVVIMNNVPGRGIAGAAPINSNGGTYSGKAPGNLLLSTAFRTKSPTIRALTTTIAPDSNAIVGVAGNRIGVSAGLRYSSVVGTANTMSESSLKFCVIEAAWNQNHRDSVEGYQIQAQKVSRIGDTSDWYDFNRFVTSTAWTASNATFGNINHVEINCAAEPFYTLLLTPDGDGAGNYYTNSASLFNDSSIIRIRVRPFIGSADPLRGQVGTWSSPLAFVDNTAPCDSDFVTAVNCYTVSKGGIQLSENIHFNNAAGSSATDTGYIEVTFPEDMNPSGPPPSISFFYGPFGGTNPPLPLDTVAAGSDRSRWISARKYRIYVSVPVFDYTYGATDSGSYYSVSVAGCKDYSGNVIQAYGTRGTLATSDINAAGRKTRTEAAVESKQGSNTIIADFTRCD